MGFGSIVRVIVIMVLSLFAYTGGELLDRAIASAETAFCEEDKCVRLYILGYCLDASGSKTGCNMVGSQCKNYVCPDGGLGDGKGPIFQ